MSAKRPQSQPVPATASFDRRYLKRGKYSAIVYLPPAYHAHVGLVIAQWGQFETVFNACLDGLVNGEQLDGVGRETNNWQGDEFRRRRELFKTICTEWLSTWRPDEAKVLCQLCDTAGDLRWKRDMIAHGTYSFTLPPRTALATNCHAINHRSGQVMPFDEHILTKLHHDIGHLTGDLLFTFKRFAEIDAPIVALPDTQLLQVFRETNRRSRAKQEMHQSPRDTSEG